MPAEISELTFGAAMLLSNAKLKKACQKNTKTNSYDNFFNFFPEFKAACNDGRIIADTPAKKREYTSKIDGSSKCMNDIIKGISAAIALRADKDAGMNDSWIPDAVFLTGDKWPAEIEKFAVNSYGWSGYNSADVILRKGRKYFGVSLKKKGSVNDLDPTIINKVFDSVLNKELIGETYSYAPAPKPKRTARNNSEAVADDAKMFGEIKEQLESAKAKYFAGLVWRAAHEKNILDPKDIPELKNMKAPPDDAANIKALYEAKGRNRKLFPDPYISVKLWKKSPKDLWANGTPYDTDKKAALKDSKSMRYFVNNELGKENNPLWGEYVSIMNRYASLFGNALINLVLKTKLYDKLKAQDISENEFAFFLVTGIGTVTINKKDDSKSTVSLGIGHSMSLKTVLCGLYRIERDYGKYPYQVVIDDKKMKDSLASSRRNKDADPSDEESGAAKVFMQLKRGPKSGGITVLNLELRYKGKFNPQPQFFATVDDDYKNLLKKECRLKVT